MTGSSTQCCRRSCRRRQRLTQSALAGRQCRRHRCLPSRRRVSPSPISSILKSISCCLFHCRVIIAVDVIALHCRHRYDAGPSWSLVGGPLQTPGNASTSSVSSGTSSTQKACHSPMVVGQVRCRSHCHTRHHYLHHRHRHRCRRRRHHHHHNHRRHRHHLVAITAIIVAAVTVAVAVAIPVVVSIPVFVAVATAITPPPLPLPPPPFRPLPILFDCCLCP